jgi:hypothetical protein
VGVWTSSPNVEAVAGDSTILRLDCEGADRSGWTTSSSSSSSDPSSSIASAFRAEGVSTPSSLSLPICLTCFKLAEHVREEGPGTMTLSYDDGDKEKSWASSSSGTIKAGEGGEGGRGTVRGSIERVMYASLVVGAGLTDSLGLETMISSGSEVFRRTGGREGGLAVVLIARVGFRTGSLGVATALAGIEWGTTAGLGGDGLEDLPPVSFLMKDENDDPDR